MYRLTTTYISGQIKSNLFEEYKDAENAFYDKKRNPKVAKMIIHRTTANKAPKVMLWYE